jgi:hypothetical protein
MVFSFFVRTRLPLILQEFVTSGNRRMAARLSSVVRCVYLDGETHTRKAISKPISGAGNGIRYASALCLCRAIGALGSENDLAGFELPIRKE